MKNQLQAVILLSILVGCSSPKRPATLNHLPLRKLATLHDKYFGSAVQARLLREDPAYSAMISKEFNVLTPENELKFDWVEKERDQFNFTDSDQIVEFAKNSGSKVRGHTLVWHRALPEWITKGVFTPSELEEILKNHITKVMKHYSENFPEEFIGWDVVNEAFDDNNEIRRDSLWSAIGPDKESFISKAFHWAHAANPKAKLFYNDYGNHDLGPRANATYELLKKLIKQGVPIHGVGLQMHLEPRYPVRIADVRRNLRRLADLGLEIHITEFDTSVTKNAKSMSKELAAQAIIYHEVAQACVEEKACHAFVSWGFTDRYSWLNSEQSDFGLALYFDNAYQPKASYYGLTQALEESSTN